MPHAGRSLALSLMTLVFLGPPLGPRETEVGGPVADLEGDPIALADAGAFHCHDLDHPAIHCFRSADALESAVAAAAAQQAADPVALGGTAVAYVRIFEHSSFSGASAYLSQDYGNLGTIGWNDRISSYLVLNSETGAFHTATSYGGTTDYFCCNESVGSLGSLDNTFSSVRRT